MPVDRIARLGCDPSKMVLYRPGDLDDCLNTTETFVVNVRTQSDVAMKYPIYVGFDSVSAIAGTELDPDTGEPLDPKGKGLGYHARRFSEFFRDKLGFLASKNVILLGTGQHKTGFTTIGNKQMASGKTSLAEGTFKFYSSWIITMKKEACDRVGADTIVCRSSKNKLGPKRREIKMLLYNDHRGWDFDYGTASLLFSSFGPFSAKTEKAEEATCWKQHFGKDEFAALPGGLYTHSRVAGGLKYHAPEFVQAFYENTELVMQVREYWKVRGFGFAFEDVKVPWDENNAPVEPGAAEVDEDDEDEAALAAAEAHIGEIAGEAETPLPVVESAAGVPKLPGADYPKEVRRAK